MGKDEANNQREKEAVVTRTVDAAAKDRPFVLGSNGRAFKNLLQAFRVRVSLAGDLPVTVTGPERRVEGAIRRIQVLTHKADTTRIVTGNVRVRPDKEAALLGFTEEERRVFPARFPDVQVFIPDHNKKNKHEKWLHLSGPEDQMAGALRFFQDRISAAH